MPIIPDNDAVLALDVGDKRVGVAVASWAARLPRPLTTLMRGESFLSELRGIVDEEKAGMLVVGLPRGLDGQHTAQTAVTEGLVAELRQEFNLPIYVQDEAGTSRKAAAELKARGRHQPVKGEVDALAAVYILEDFLASYNTKSNTEIS